MPHIPEVSTARMTGGMIQHELSQKYGQTTGFQSCNAESLDPIVPGFAEAEENVAKSSLRRSIFGLSPLAGLS